MLFWLPNGFHVIQYHQKPWLALPRVTCSHCICWSWCIMFPYLRIDKAEEKTGRIERRWNKQREQNGMQWPQCSVDDTSRKHFIHQRGEGLSLWKLLQIKDTPWWIELWREWIWIPHRVIGALRKAFLQPLVTVLLFKLLSPASMPECTLCSTTAKPSG